MVRWSPWVPLYALSLLTATVVIGLGWRRRASTPLAGSLIVGMSACAVWTALNAAAAVTTSNSVVVAATLAVLPVAAVTANAVLVLCRQLASRAWHPDRRSLILLGLEPGLIALLAATNGWHPFLLAGIDFGGSPPVLTARLGVAFWLHTAYCYAMITVGFGLLIRARRQAHLFYRHQFATILVALAIPVVGSAVSLLLLILTKPVGDTAVLFVASASIISYAVFRQGLLQLVPIARQLVLEQVGDAVLVLDPEGTVVDHNAAMRQLVSRLPGQPAELVGLDVRGILGPQADLDVAVPRRLRLSMRDGVAELDYRVSDLHDQAGRLLGRVAVTRDVTEQVRQSRELEQANARLRSQLAVIEQLRAELAEQAIRDELTGLHNRRHLLHQWAIEMDRCRRDGRHLTVLLIDVDHFKRINDAHGHPVGDEVLVALARLLTGSLRPGDLLARYGGEEIVAVLPGLGRPEAGRRAEEMRMLCAGLEVAASAGPVRVTVSIGGATYPESGRSLDELLRAADEALYRAKALGRNQVVVGESART